jgi:hypothetical protein
MSTGTGGAFSFALQPGNPAAIAQGQPVCIETEHYVTRSMKAADVTAEMVQWFNDANMLQGLNLSALNFSLDGLRAFVASFNNLDNYLIGIFSKTAQDLLGFYNFSVNRRHRVATLTLGASPRIRTGRAIFWESWFPLFDEMVEQRGIDKITSRVLTSNRKLLYAMLGTVHFVYEGTLRQEILGLDNQRLDVMVLSAFKDPGLRPKP